jgi:2,4-dienoyl-CoA reductase-like NADH-dependent reductase (Old Yellow Enzyme family)
LKSSKPLQRELERIELVFGSVLGVLSKVSKNFHSFVILRSETIRRIFFFLVAMRMKDPIPQFSYAVEQLAERFPSLSYLHLIEPRVVGGGVDRSPTGDESLDFARKIWRKTGRPLLVAGGYTPEIALEHMLMEGRENDVIVFGRRFIANVSWGSLSLLFYDFIELVSYSQIW